MEHSQARHTLQSGWQRCLLTWSFLTITCLRSNLGRFLAALKRVIKNAPPSFRTTGETFLRSRRKNLMRRELNSLRKLKRTSTVKRDINRQPLKFLQDSWRRILTAGGGTI